MVEQYYFRFRAAVVSLLVHLILDDASRRDIVHLRIDQATCVHAGRDSSALIKHGPG